MLLLCPHCIETSLVGINSETIETRTGQAKQKFYDKYKAWKFRDENKCSLIIWGKIITLIHRILDSEHSTFYIA